MGLEKLIDPLHQSYLNRKEEKKGHRVTKIPKDQLTKQVGLKESKGNRPKLALTLDNKKNKNFKSYK